MQQKSFGGFPLSSQQRWLWVGQSQDQRERLKNACHVRITGPLDVDRLADALRAVIARHEILRTYFEIVPGMRLPLQFIAHPSEVRLGGNCAVGHLEGYDQGGESRQSGLLSCLSMQGPNDYLLKLTASPLCLDLLSY